MSVISEQQQHNSLLRLQFFSYLFGDGGVDSTRGYLCIATADVAKQNFRQKFFMWPDQKEDLLGYIESVHKTRNVWFNVSLLNSQERRKEFCLPIGYAWAEWDQEYVGDLEPQPSLVVESSPGKFHAYWRIEGSPVPPDVAEDFSRRIAYRYGADKSGWDSVQLLRVPFTMNLKYDPPAEVKLVSVVTNLISVDVLDAIAPPIETNGEVVDLPAPMPDPATMPDVDSIIYRYKAEGRLSDVFFELYAKSPAESADWSRILWRFIRICLEAGMTVEETFIVSLSAACNKYHRDNRPVQYLWRDIVKSERENTRYVNLVGGKFEVLKMPQIVDEDDIEEDSFIKEYKDWARIATDAPEQYHELAVFIALSAVICSGLYVKMSWGEVSPNIWGLILGESSVTRKTTAMDLPMDIITDIDESLIVASDGSAEGLLTALSHRPERVSIYYRDEVTGLFDSMDRKDYLAGLPQTFTKLYDVPKILPRVLRKETITICKPYFIFFGGGIREKLFSSITEDYVISGFIPRFLIVSGENDRSRMRRPGPPSQQSSDRKNRIVQGFADLYERYNATATSIVAGQKVEFTSRIEAKLTEDAWELYGDIDEKFTDAAQESDLIMVASPTFSRLSGSLLKLSLLVAASRRTPTTANQLIVEKSDILQAAFYIQKWGHYTVDMLMNVGKGTTEKLVDRAMALINKKDGITKAEFMQRLHLSARDSRELIDTLIQRGLIEAKTHGRGHRLYLI